MIIPTKFNGYTKDGIRRLYMGGGGGGGQTTSTVQNTNIPEYAQQYVENMLGATQEQLFTGTRGPSTTNPETGEVTQGNFQIEGFKPYQAYGGTYDQNKTLADGKPNPNYGQQLTYDPTKGIAGFTPAQIAAQRGIVGQYDPVTGKLAVGADGKPINAGLQMPSEFDDASTGIKGFIGAKNAYTAPSNLGYTATDATARDATARDATAGGYNSTDAAAIKADAAKLAALAPSATEKTSTFAPTLEKYSMGDADKVATKSFTDKGVAASYMSPYTTNVLDIQNKELERQASIDRAKRGAQAARAGAFGGSRQAVEDAEANRGLAMMKNANTAQGMQRSYEQAMQQFNAEQGYGLQGQIANQQAGLTVGQQNLGAKLGVQQLDTQTDAQIELANLANKQQTELANLGLKGQYGLTQGQFDQAANMQTSGQAQQAALANAAAKSAASQFGAAATNQASLANAAGSNQVSMANAAGSNQVSLANAAAKNAAAQFTAGQNLASAQTAAQYGLSANQLGLQASTQLGALGGQELAAKQGILGLQNQVGAQQQALDQAAKNQAIQDYANTQQYPLMQLGTMSNMLRGLPMQASTTNQYAASPNPVSQAVGTIGAGASIYNAFNPAAPKAAGGVIKGYAEGGIMSYDMGGEVEGQLENMDEKGLATQARESTSPSIRRMAQRILRERQMGNKPQGTGPMGVQYQAAQPEMPSLRGGGIIAFQQGGGAKPYYGPSSEDDSGEDRARIGMEERLAMPPTTEGGIMGATAQSKTPIPVAPAGPSPDIVKEAIRQRDIYSTQANRPRADVVKDIQAEQEASGIGNNQAREDYRVQQMAERANMKDEQNRQRNLRLAEFFASWGSTPGPVLVAGMNALKQSIPGIITDEKEAKKARREADKIIYDIDEATRLEKLGLHDKASARIEKAASHAQDFNKQLITFESQRQSDKKSLEVAGIQAKAQTDAAAMRNASDKSISAAAGKRADEATRNNFQRQALETKRAAENLESQIAKEAKDTMEYTTAKRMSSTTKIKPEDRKKADATIKEYETGWATRRQNAKADQDLAKEQLREINERLGYGKKPDNAGGGGAAANRPSLNDPSLQKP